MGFDFNITKPVHKMWCRLMLQRYIGKFLERQLALDQLSVDLVQGSVEIEDLSLNVTAVNEIINKLNLPIKLIDGFIGKIAVVIPWTSLMAKPTEMKISELQLTFQPTGPLKFEKEELNSMVESMMHSLVSSGELARSVRDEIQKDGHIGELTGEESVDSFAKIIDAIYSKFCVILEKTTVRVEFPPQEDSLNMCTAFELRVDKAKFMDEQMRSAEDNEKIPELITSQPHGIGSITNLNKFLTLDGVTMYTDIFSNILDELEDNSLLITSMHIRREKMKQISPCQSPDLSMHQDMYTSTMSNATAFHSCYASMVQDTTDPPSPTRLDPLKPAPAEPDLFSNPVQFLDIVGQTTVVFRLHNAAHNINKTEPDENRIDTEIFIKGVNIFACPSQIAILQKLGAALSVSNERSRGSNEKRMAREDYENILRSLEEMSRRKQLEQHEKKEVEVDPNLPPKRKALPMHGGLRFVETEDVFSDFDSVHVEGRKDQKQDESSTESPNDREVTNLKTNIGDLLLYIPHCDYLSTSYVKSNGGYHNTISELKHDSERFFLRAQTIEFPTHTNLEKMRSSTDKLYLKDHIRVIGSTVAINYTGHKAPTSESMQTKFIVSHCDVLEYLSRESVPSSSTSMHLPLLDYSEMVNEDNDPNLKIVLSRSNETRGKPQLEVFISPCKTELDLSIMDRVADLIVTKPFFFEKREMPGRRKDIMALKDDLFPATSDSMNILTTVMSKNWMVNLRIPIADLRDPQGSRLPFAQRHVHDEYLQLIFKDIKVKIPNDSEELTKIELLCNEISGDFCGDNLDIPAEQARILYGVKNGLDKVSINVVLDSRTRRTPIVSRINIPVTISRGGGDDEMGVYSPVFMVRPKKDGPFAKVPQSFNADGMEESEEIIQAGSREEIIEFMEECINFTSFKLLFDVPNLRLHIPEKKYLEILYNRLVNDMALFQPAAPALRSAEEQQLRKQSFESFQECPRQRGYDSEGSDIGREDEDEEIANISMSESEEFDRYVPHTFATALNARKCTVLCNTVHRKNSVEKGASQVSLELDKVNLGATVGFHGDMNHNYFHFTSSQAAVGSTNVSKRSFSKQIEQREFGKWGSEDRQVEFIPAGDEFSPTMEGDALSVGVHLRSRPELNVMDRLICVAFRNSYVQMKPVNDSGLLWAVQLAELFTLEDYAVPGYELLKVTTDFRLTFDNAVGEYDHAWINPASDYKLKALLGSVQLSSTFLEKSNVSKVVCLLENSALYMSSGVVKNSPRSGSRPKPEFVPVLNIGLIHFDVLISAETDMSKRRTPLYEVNFQNDCITFDVCSDSLAALATIGFEMSSSEKFGASSTEEEAGDFDDDETEVGSIRKSSRHSSEEEMPADVARRIKECVEDAMRDIDSEVAYGKEAVDEFRYTSNSKKKSYNDIDDIDFNPHRQYKCDGDDEFCMVDADLLGCGITNVPGEPRVHHPTVNRNFKIESGHFVHPDHWQTDQYKDTAKLQKIPLLKYNFKDVSIQLNIYAGNDLQKRPSPNKSYSVEEYKRRFGNEEYQRGGSFRDHSACVIVQLQKITFKREIFDRDAPKYGKLLFAIQDIVIRDEVKASDIKEMLYQYSTSDNPCRKNAPLISLRRTETHTREGKLRVSMLPIKINIDQDTLEFIYDFVEETKKLIQFPKDFNMPDRANYRPIIEVPAEIKDRRSSRKESKSSSSSMCSASHVYPTLQKPSLSMEPLKPTPVRPPPSLGDLSYLENREKRVPASPLKYPLIDAPLTASAVSIGEMFSPASSRRAPSSNYNIPASPVDDPPSSNSSFLNNVDLDGDWHDELNSNFLNITDEHEQVSANDILSRSTMMGSIHPAMTNDLVDTSSDHEDHGNFLDGIDEDDDEEEEDDDKQPSGSGYYTNAPPEEELQRQEIFYKEFVFSPAVNIFVDYQGKRKMSVDKTGALVGLLMAFGQLNQMPITLREINNSHGLLGMSSCFKLSVEEWTQDLLNSMPSIIASYGPITPFVQIGKGIFDLVMMPMAEMRKENGRVVKGIQDGFGSFGTSSAAGLVGMAQTITGFAQSIAEMTMREMKQDDPQAIARKNRRPSRTQDVNPSDIRHSLQLAYGILYDGYHQTKDDYQMAAQENRTGGGSVIRSAVRYAVPTFISPVVMATRVTYQLLGGLRSQLRPDLYRDERRKWGEGNVPGGVGRR